MKGKGMGSPTFSSKCTPMYARDSHTTYASFVLVQTRQIDENITNTNISTILNT